MYLITTINSELSGWEIIVASSSLQECNEELEKLQKSVWFNEDGTKKMFSDIYDDTRAKNARIVTNREAERIFGGKKNLEMAVDFLIQAESDAERAMEDGWKYE